MKYKGTELREDMDSEAGLSEGTETTNESGGESVLKEFTKETLGSMVDFFGGIVRREF